MTKNNKKLKLDKCKAVKSNTKNNDLIELSLSSKIFKRGIQVRQLINRISS